VWIGELRPALGEEPTLGESVEEKRRMIEIELTKPQEA
jgi:hypothetical protein